MGYRDGEFIWMGLAALVLALLPACSWLSYEQVQNPGSWHDCGTMGYAKVDVLGSSLRGAATPA